MVKVDQLIKALANADPFSDSDSEEEENSEFVVSFLHIVTSVI
jgi:hypothetical protein